MWEVLVYTDNNTNRVAPNKHWIALRELILGSTMCIIMETS
jgi:hypothetical protein